LSNAGTEELDRSLSVPEHTHSRSLNPVKHDERLKKKLDQGR